MATNTENMPTLANEKVMKQEELLASDDTTSRAETPKPEEGPKDAIDLQFWLLFLGLFLVIICIGLDRSIVAVATPEITSDFNSLDDVAWYGSAFMLAMSCLQLLAGKLYAEFHIKWIFLSALVLFEVGSIICAAAPSSAVLIVGRAVSGVGGAGLASGAFILIAKIVPLHRIPQFSGALGAGMAIAQIIAPTLGGVFTDKATWRWCFWINLPLGGITLLVVFFFVKVPSNPAKQRATIAEFVDKIDLPGTLLLIPWTICLLFSLQWGGIEYPWSNWRIILLFTLFGILFIAWVAVQIIKGEKATVPVRIITQRSMASGLFYTFCSNSGFFVVMYYVPIWFQAVRGDSAYQSGINLLTACASSAVALIFAGLLTTKIGYYVPSMIVGSTLASVGAGLIYTFDADTSNGFWIASLIIFGVGIGLGLQQPLIAGQTVFRGSDIPLTTSSILFMQGISISIMLSVSQSVFQSHLLSGLSTHAPEVDHQFIIETGASNVHQAVADKYPDSLDGVLKAYNDALQQVFLICVVLTCLSIFGGAGMEWISVKKEKQKREEEKNQQAVAE